VACEQDWAESLHRSDVGSIRWARESAWLTEDGINVLNISGIWWLMKQSVLNIIIR
jgi:hypothetical protein